MAALLANYGFIIGLVVSILVCFNSILTAVKKVLDKRAPTGAADSFVTKILGGLGTVIEFMTANSTVLPASAQEELKPQPPVSK